MHDLLKELPKKIFLWGAIGPSKSLKDVIGFSNSRIIAVFDDNPKISSPFADIPIHHGWDQFLEWSKEQDKVDLGFAIGITGKGRDFRVELHEKFVEMNLQPATIVHPSAIIARDAVIGEGSQIMAGAIIGPDSRIGRQCMINANASIDHDNIIEDGAEIAPGATLCGMVSVGANAWIGAGATVLPMVKIGRDVIVGAGSVVMKDVTEGTTVVGIPAKPLAKK